MSSHPPNLLALILRMRYKKQFKKFFVWRRYGKGMIRRFTDALCINQYRPTRSFHNWQRKYREQSKIYLLNQDTKSNK